MAQNVNYGTGFGMPLHIIRENPQPLEANSFFTSLSDAQDYALNNPTAYIGQLLTIRYSNGGVDTIEFRYITAGNTAATVLSAPFGSTTDISEAVTQLNNVGYQGTITTLKSKFNTTTGAATSKVFKGAIYNIANATELTDLKALINLNSSGTGDALDAEVGDWVMFSADVAVGATLPATSIGLWEKNLTGAVTSVSGGTATTGKYVNSVTKQAGSSEIVVTETDLPVKQVTVETATGVTNPNVITGVTYNTTGDANTLTITKGKIKSNYKLRVETITVTQASGTTPNYVYNLSYLAEGMVQVALNGVVQQAASTLYEYAESNGVTALTTKAAMNIEIGDELTVTYITTED